MTGPVVVLPDSDFRLMVLPATGDWIDGVIDNVGERRAAEGLGESIGTLRLWVARQDVPEEIDARASVVIEAMQAMQQEGATLETMFAFFDGPLSEPWSSTEAARTLIASTAGGPELSVLALIGRASSDACCGREDAEPEETLLEVVAEAAVAYAKIHASDAPKAGEKDLRAGEPPTDGSSQDRGSPGAPGRRPPPATPGGFRLRPS